MRFETSTIKDIAKALGLSASTVSRALRDRYEISKETKKLVLAYAEKVNYRANPIARSLKERRSYSIGIIVSEIANNFFSQVINGIESIAYNKDYHVIISQSHESYKQEKLNVEHLASRSIDGLLIALSSETQDIDYLKDLYSKGLPIVFFDRVPDGFETHKVIANNFKGSYDATEHLILSGKNVIAHLTNSETLSNTKERLEGYKAALAKYHIEFRPELVKYCQHGGMHSEELEVAVKELLSLKPNGIFISSDRLTTGCIMALKNTNPEIAHRIAIAGFTNSNLVELFSPSLTSVKQPAFEMGQVATELLISMIEAKQPITEFQTKVLNTELVKIKKAVRELSHIKEILFNKSYICPMIEIVLKKGKEKAALQRHPWVFSGALEKVKGKPEDGEVVKVFAFDHEFLAYGYFNSNSRVAIRLLEWDEDQTIDQSWYKKRLKQAIASRQLILNEETDTCRLVFSEADFLPGLIVDQYGDFLSLQILSSGIEKVKKEVVDILRTELNPKGIFDKSDATARGHEGLPLENGLLWGEAPPEFLAVKENGTIYNINIAEGQKSGFYCDQRDNRRILASYAKGKRVLDCFSYSGGFSLNSLANGAESITSVDSSGLAVETLKQNVVLNHFDETKVNAIQSDVNKQLRAFKESGDLFDVIILDPPKYAPSRSALDRAARAYKDLNRLGLLLLEKGGLLATFSCSGAVDIETFKQIIAWAALDAGKEVQIIKQFCQPEDHPVRISFPEGEYLKGLLLRVL